jgi:hypothetical protein
MREVETLLVVAEHLHFGRAAAVTEVLGLPLHVLPLDADEARAELLTQRPEPYVEAFLDFCVAGSLDESAPLPTVERVLHRRPLHRLAVAPSRRFLNLLTLLDRYRPAHT